jgi:LETM1 and EF-hand domain-containing protein 1
LTISQVRQGRHVTNNDLLDVAALFKDELTLDRLSRQQLLSMSRYMGLSAYGSDARLLYELEKRLDEIRDDDQVCFRTCVPLFR